MNKTNRTSDKTLTKPLDLVASSREVPANFDLGAFLAHLTERPGVYLMHNSEGKVIYVGKAKNLKRRVGSYFNKQQEEIKTRSMVAQVAFIETTLTDTEAEALILENTLIKRYKPKYNILFRDDKSYPYIYVSTDKAFPALGYHRGAKRRQGAYFGPFPNGAAVHQTLQTLQKIFPVRQCSESVFQHRSRPCLQYQIKRCSGPCVEGLVSAEDYATDVRHTLQFLQGKSFEVIEELGQKMQVASEALEFETAARLRDQVQALRVVQSQHLINQPSQQDIDVIALAEQAGQVCLTLMSYRGGQLWGSEHYFPKQAQQASHEAILLAFMTQHYATFPVANTILLPLKLEEKALVEHFLTDRAQHKVMLKTPKTQMAKDLLQLAQTNAQSGLQQRLTQKASQLDRVQALQQVLSLEELPQVMECFDISHTQGEHTVASCVVFKQGVPHTASYRKFNIEGIQGGDDYAAMHQAVERRYQGLVKADAPLPDLVVIDGGKGQLKQAQAVLADLGLSKLALVSVAKGEGRKAGLEILYTPDHLTGIDLPADHLALHLINYIRDEAHRFAISQHRARRQKAQMRSRLEDIAGVGAKTRQKLLVHFGGLNAVKEASITELQKVPGVSVKLAQAIYDFFHGEA